MAARSTTRYIRSMSEQAALPDPWLVGVWIPIIGIVATLFLGGVAIVISVRSSRSDRERSARRERSEFAGEIEKLFSASDFNAALRVVTNRADALDPPAIPIIEWVRSAFYLIGWPHVGGLSSGYGYGSVSGAPMGFQDNRVRALRAETVRRVRAWVETGVFDSGTFKPPPLED